MPMVTSTNLGQNLHQTQSLFKKHKKLQAEIVGHRPMIDKTLASGQTLIDQNHPEREKVKLLRNIKILDSYKLIIEEKLNLVSGLYN